MLDGATAIYGSDAIAGVVNYILKKNTTAFNAYGQATVPQKSGGGGANAGLSKGWGDLDKDGWNVNFSYSYNKQDSLAASQRDFSRNGAVFPFTANGTKYIFNQATSNTEPANITFNARPKSSPPGTEPTSYSLNPYYTQNGNCGSPLASALTDFNALGAVGVSCRFNYAATVQDIPSSETNNVIVKGYLKLGADATLWGLVGLSRFDMTAQYAPGAQPLSANSTNRFPSLYNAYVQPFLNANNLVNTATGASQATIGYRAVSNGGRTDDYVTDWQQYAAGVDGRALGWDYNARLVSSLSKFSDKAAGGYTDFDGFNSAVAPALGCSLEGRTGGGDVTVLGASTK